MGITWQKGGDLSPFANQLLAIYQLWGFSSRQAVEFLSSEGHIYSTVDDDHYKSTDAE